MYVIGYLSRDKSSLFERKKTAEYRKRLSSEEWAKQANMEKLNNVLERISGNNMRVWDEEMLRIIPEGTKCLEIGCGTGITSLYLAKEGRNVTALDYTMESIELVKSAAEKLSLNISTVCCDATKEMPFDVDEFDYIFQCGLLEHFNSHEQIELLKNGVSILEI